MSEVTNRGMSASVCSDEVMCLNNSNLDRESIQNCTIERMNCTPDSFAQRTDEQNFYNSHACKYMTVKLANCEIDNSVVSEDLTSSTVELQLKSPNHYRNSSNWSSVGELVAVLKNKSKMVNHDPNTIVECLRMIDSASSTGNTSNESLHSFGCHSDRDSNSDGEENR